jgi:hypothetical protein
MIQNKYFKPNFLRQNEIEISYSIYMLIRGRTWQEKYMLVCLKLATRNPGAGAALNIKYHIFISMIICILLARFRSDRIVLGT